MISEELLLQLADNGIVGLIAVLVIWRLDQRMSQILVKMGDLTESVTELVTMLRDQNGSSRN